MTTARRPWAGSTRRARLPKNWAVLRRRVLARDHGICHACHQPGATEVDHLEPGDNHNLTNLAAIHTACHNAKSSREGVAARAARPGRKRRPEPHPGRVR